MTPAVGKDFVLLSCHRRSHKGSKPTPRTAALSTVAEGEEGDDSRDLSMRQERKETSDAQSPSLASTAASSIASPNSTASPAPVPIPSAKTQKALEEPPHGSLPSFMGSPMAASPWRQHRITDYNFGDASDIESRDSEESEVLSESEKARLFGRIHSTPPSTKLQPRDFAGVDMAERQSDNGASDTEDEPKSSDEEHKQPNDSLDISYISGNESDSEGDDLSPLKCDEILVEPRTAIDVQLLRHIHDMWPSVQHKKQTQARIQVGIPSM